MIGPTLTWSTCSESSVQEHLIEWTTVISSSKAIYTRGFVLDGNFKLAHVKQKRPEDDVWLSNGHGMMTEDIRYRKHIALAIEDKEVNTVLFTG